MAMETDHQGSQALVHVPDSLPAEGGAEEHRFHWEFRFVYVDPNGVLGIQDGMNINALYWNLASKDQNRMFSHVWRNLCAAENRNLQTPLPTFATVFQKGGYSSSKYIIDGIQRYEDQNLEFLIYKHEVLEEWVIVKMIRTIKIEAGMGSVSLSSIEIRMKTIVHSFHDDHHGDTGPILSLCSLGPECMVPSVIDLILVHLRKEGKFTAHEIHFSLSKKLWTFESIMLKDARNRSLGSFCTMGQVALPSAIPESLLQKQKQQPDEPDH